MIYLVDIDPTGIIGLILNRISSLNLDEVFPDFSPLVCPPVTFFQGGPVATDGAVCLAKPMNPLEEPPGWQRVNAEIGILDLDTPVEIVRGTYSDMRIFSGYSGWTCEQLADEMASGAWHVAKSLDEDIFTADPDGLWRSVLRRQRGPVSFLTTWTRTPERN